MARQGEGKTAALLQDEGWQGKNLLLITRSTDEAALGYRADRRAAGDRRAGEKPLWHLHGVPIYGLCIRVCPFGRPAVRPPAG